MNDQSDEETDDPLLADDRNFYKVEKWTQDGIIEGWGGQDCDRAILPIRTS